MLDILNKGDAPNLVKGVDKSPELLELTLRFQSAVNRFDGLTCEIQAKLQKIKRYSEPEPESENKVLKQAESFTDEAHLLISKVEYYNSRLEFNLRHLAEII